MRFTLRALAAPLAPFALAAACVALPCNSGVAHAQTAFISEFMFNAPGADNGREFFEIGSSVPGQSLAGLTLLVIEAEGGSASRGAVTAAIALTDTTTSTALSTGANGLLLYQDSVTPRNPAPAAGTVVYAQDFNPDVQNGSQTYALVQGYTGGAGFDFDTDNDGVVDVADPFTSLLDVAGYIDGDNAADVAYLADRIPMRIFTASIVANPYAYFRTPQGEGVFTEIDSASPAAGPYTYFGANTFAGRTPTSSSLTPGNANPTLVAVPDAGTLPLVALGVSLLGGVGAVRRRKRA